jgi:hypothetical protein
MQPVVYYSQMERSLMDCVVTTLDPTFDRGVGMGVGRLRYRDAIAAEFPHTSRNALIRALAFPVMQPKKNTRNFFWETEMVAVPVLFTPEYR